MANLAYLFNGGAPLVKVLQIQETISTAGTPVEMGTDGEDGVALAAGDTTTDFLGMTLNTGTYSTTQATAGATVEVIINPDAVWRLLMVNDGGSAQLAILTNSAAATGGLTATITTGDDDPSSPSHDQGTIACVSGGNVGLTRVITSVTTTTAVTTNPFPRTIAVNDTFVTVPWNPVAVGNNQIRFSNNYGGAQRTVAQTTGADFAVIDLDWAWGGASRTRQNSHLNVWCVDHAYGQDTAS